MNERFYNKILFDRWKIDERTISQCSFINDLNMLIWKYDDCNVSISYVNVKKILIFKLFSI